MIYKDHPDFQPNVTPEEMFKLGIFGGGYFRPIYSKILGKNISEADEFTFTKDQNRAIFDVNTNYYKVKAGTDLEYWEENGWIFKEDPYGWVQWYCRFHAGRRLPIDRKQINKWLNNTSPRGRFRKLCIKILGENKPALKLKQVLLQWGFFYDKKT